MSNHEPQPVPPPHRALLATLLMTLLVSGLTIYFWNSLQAQRQQHLLDDFETDIGEIRTKIAERMISYGEILKGGRSLFLASQHVSREEWHDYVTGLQLEADYPGIQGIGFAESIDPDKLAAHEAEIRRQGFPNYRVWPEGRRELYSAIIYLEPFDWRNRRAFGYDMFSQSTRHEAMARARDSGNPALTGKVLLVQETNKQPQAGTLLYVPLYRKGVPLDTVTARRKALLGWVYSPFRMDNLIEGMLGKRSSDTRLRIYDQDDSQAGNLLYDSLDVANDLTPTGILAKKTLSMQIGGRTWVLNFEALPSYANAVNQSSLRLEGFGMLLIGLLLIALTWSMFNTQHASIRLAHKLTASLRESEERWSFALEGSDEGVWDWDIDSGEVFYSPFFCRMLGLSEQAMGNDLEAWKQLLHPDDANRTEAMLQRHLRGETPEFACEYRLRHSNGSYIWVKGHSKVMNRSAGGQPLRLVGTQTDVTERKKSDEHIRLLSESVHQAGEAIIMTNARGIIEYVNPAFSRITGYSLQEAIGQTPALLNSGVQDSKVYKDMWTTIMHGKTWQGRMVDRKKDGSFYPAMLTISPIAGEDGSITHFVGVQQDLKEYEDMEARFHQSQKMEAIGTLVGGIAHDFNNTLAGITGNIYLAKQQLPENPEALKRLSTAEQLSFRAAEMIKQLLTFSRKSRTEMTPVAVTSFLKEAIKLQRVSLPEDIELDMEVLDSDLVVLGDINLLQQVLINLINNSRDAVAGVAAPSIRIRLEAIESDRAFMAKHPELNSGQFAHITVQDNGTGIEPENIAHVFEPFFTTKDVGKGTGLGLSMAYGAIQQHNGVMSAESVPGKGSTFHIYLPLVDAIPVETDSDVRTLHKGRGDTILLVDDHAEALATSRDVLESLNYIVLTAGDGEEAVNIYRSRYDDIDLVILDVVMPKMGGKEAFKAIREINPRARIIFATGYDRSNVQMEEGLKDVPLINKPFSITTLSRTVFNLLYNE